MHAGVLRPLLTMGGSLYYGLPSRVSQLSNETRLYCGFTVVLLISRVVNAHYHCFLGIHETGVGLFRDPEAMLVTLLVGNS